MIQTKKCVSQLNVNQENITILVLVNVKICFVYKEGQMAQLEEIAIIVLKAPTGQKIQMMKVIYVWTNARKVMNNKKEDV